MTRRAQTTAVLAALALPLLLWQGGRAASCGGGGGLRVETSVDGGGVAEGTWGGEGVRLEVRADGADVEFDCAHGSMGKLTADSGGNFSADGTFARERGGPAISDEKEEKLPARYSGRVEGGRMTLRLSVEGLGELPSFKLTHGAAAELRKCL